MRRVIQDRKLGIIDHSRGIFSVCNWASFVINCRFVLSKTSSDKNWFQVLDIETYFKCTWVWKRATLLELYWAFMSQNSKWYKYCIFFLLRIWKSWLQVRVKFQNFNSFGLQFFSAYQKEIASMIFHMRKSTEGQVLHDWWIEEMNRELLAVLRIHKTWHGNNARTNKHIWK